MDETDRMSMRDDDYSMLSEEDILAAFPDHPEVAQVTQEIAQKCNLRLELGGILMPEFPIPDGETIDDHFLAKTYRGLNKKYGSGSVDTEKLGNDIEASDLKITGEIWERFQYEYGVITAMKYQGYFLIVADFINWAKDQGISVGPGRGSGAGSIIAYALNITELDPLKYRLLFERFLNPDRISMPDFDTDFADSRRNEVVEYVAKKYGRDHVAQIITFGTMAARMAVRDVGRVLSMSYSEVDTIAKLIPFGQTLEQALTNISEIKELVNTDAKVKKCIEIAKRLEGVVRHASMHAAGVVISKEKLTHYCPLQGATKGDLATITQYSMNPLEHLGLLKFDFLGLANLTIVQNALRIIRKTKDTNLDIDALPLDDSGTYKLLAQAHTTGVFQLESDGMKRYLRDLRPSVFEDIIAMVALYRPGPMQFIDSFIARKHGREPINYPHPTAESALKNTYGIIVYQEQLMQLSKDMANFTGGQADTLRKATGKKIKELMKKVGKEFIEGCVKNNIDRKIAESLYDSMQDFAQYSFNKSHAACYALIAYQTAYLKAHYPSEFMAALMTSEQSDLDKLAICISECERMKIKVLPPSVNESFVDFGVVKENENIRFGLSAIKNVGEQVAEEIVEERKEKKLFKDIEDFITRLGPKVINKKSLESLIMAGALDDLGERAELLYNVDKMLGYAQVTQRAKTSGQDSLFGEAEEFKTAKIEFEQAKPADKKQRLSWERELLGMYVSEHPLAGISHIIEPHRTIKISEVTAEHEGDFVRISGIITSIQKILTRSNQNMVFAKIEDLNANLEVLVFPKLLAGTSEIWLPDKIVAVDGYINFKDGTPKLLSEAIYEIAEQQEILDFVPRPKKTRGNWGKNGNGNGYSRNGYNGGAKKELYLDKVEKKYDKPPIDDNPKTLTISVPPHSDKSILLEIKSILTENPGPSPVIIRVPNNGSGYRDMRIKNKVEISQVLKKKLSELVEKNNLSIR